MYYAIDWGAVTAAAYYALYSINSGTLPIDPVNNSIIDGNLTILSYQRYSEISGVPVAEFTAGNELKDGFSVIKASGKSIVLYDDTAYHPRKKFTVAHEIGHHTLAHTVHGEKEEIEANFFASQFLAPTAIFKEIKNRGHLDSYARLIRLMELSREAEKKKLAYLEKYGDVLSHSNIYDDYVYEKFKAYLDLHFPPKKGSLRWVWNENLQRIN